MFYIAEARIATFQFSSHDLLEECSVEFYMISVAGEMFPKDRPEFGVSVGALAGAVVGTAVLCLCVGAFLGGLAVWMKYRKLIAAMKGKTRLHSNCTSQLRSKYI